MVLHVVKLCSILLNLKVFFFFFYFLSLLVSVIFLEAYYSTVIKKIDSYIISFINLYFVIVPRTEQNVETI